VQAPLLFFAYNINPKNVFVKKKIQQKGVGLNKYTIYCGWDKKRRSRESMIGTS
jgi:hypothetical protein